MEPRENQHDVSRPNNDVEQIVTDARRQINLTVRKRRREANEPSHSFRTKAMRHSYMGFRRCLTLGRNPYSPESHAIRSVASTQSPELAPFKSFALQCADKDAL